MNSDYQSLASALTALQTSLGKTNINLTTAREPLLRAVTKIQNNLTSSVTSQIGLTSQMQAMKKALTEPIFQMQLAASVTIASNVREALTINNSAIQELTKSIQNSLIDFSSRFSAEFSSALQNISFCENYVEIPENLYSFTIHEDEYQHEIPITNVAPVAKRCITLEFFLSCILPNIIALFAVWLTIHYHNVDVSNQNTTAQAEAAMFDCYTESLDQLNASISALSDYLESCSKLRPDSCSVVATNSNTVLEDDKSDFAAVDESDNPDMLLQPE